MKKNSVPAEKPCESTPGSLDPHADRILYQVIRRCIALPTQEKAIMLLKDISPNPMHSSRFADPRATAVIAWFPDKCR
jgi:hypothetical protein